MSKINKKKIVSPENYFPHLIKYILDADEIISISIEEKTREVFTGDGMIREILDGTEIITIEIYNKDKDKTKQ